MAAPENQVIDLSFYKVLCNYTWVCISKIKNQLVFDISLSKIIINNKSFEQVAEIYFDYSKQG